MPYRQFKLDNIKRELNVQIRDRASLFGEIAPVQFSDLLTQLLEKYSPLAIAIGTEKSKSEFIIAPILYELKEQLVG
ncbi:MAG: hypothetical protein AAFY33_12610 [Cyanobacteria bacterium J06643_4]